MRAQGAASVQTVTLLDKSSRRVVDLQPDYKGFEVCHSESFCCWIMISLQTFDVKECKWSLYSACLIETVGMPSITGMCRADLSVPS